VLVLVVGAAAIVCCWRLQVVAGGLQLLGILLPSVSSP